MYSIVKVIVPDTKKQELSDHTLTILFNGIVVNEEFGSEIFFLCLSMTRI